MARHAGFTDASRGCILLRHNLVTFPGVCLDLGQMVFMLLVIAGLRVTLLLWEDCLSNTPGPTPHKLDAQ